jgi:hypothetical protein
MFMMLKRSVWRASAVALVASAALVTQMSPAWAGGSGTTHHGHSNIDRLATPTSPLCLAVGDSSANPKTSITLYNTGTINTGSTQYNTKTEWNASVSYFFGPDGTYSDSACTVPYAVPGTLKITGDGIQCDDTQGPGGGTVDATYQRVGSDYTITTTEAIYCEGASTSSYSSGFTFEGTQLACSFAVENCLNGPNSIEFTGTYSQTP